MDEQKENEIQTELNSSADAAPVSDDQETDQKIESSDDVQKEIQSETFKVAPVLSDSLPEDESGSTKTDEIETGVRSSEIETPDQPAERGEATPEALKGQGGEKKGASEPGDAPDAEGTVADQETDRADEAHQSTDPASEDTDSSTASESIDESVLTAAPWTLGKVEDLDSAEEERDRAENKNTEKDQSEPEPPSEDPEAKTEDLPESESRRKRSLVKAALAAIMVAAVFSGFFIFDNKSKIKSAQKAASKEVKKAEASKTRYQKTKATIQPGDPNYVYHAKIKEVGMLRESLQHKKEEIGELKKYYQNGIAELEKEIFDEMRSAKADTFSQAIENKRIEFGLRTIQRRQAYMRQLDQPLEWIYRASEELLYLERRAMTDLQVTEVASGIDMNMHMRHMNSAIEKYRPTGDRLAVDMTAAPLEPLENLWERIQAWNLQTADRPAGSKNRIISEQVCSGAFMRVSELSEISVEAAKCIAEMPGSDLFLSDLNDISPRAAKYLFQWKGRWLCLNGFKALSPRVANYLFQWDGGWISLNGLTEFPAEIGEILLQWQGKQLELMGLRCTDSALDDIGLEYLAQWERAGGKLFVPRQVREKIDQLNGNSV